MEFAVGYAQTLCEFEVYFVNGFIFALLLVNTVKIGWVAVLIVRIV
jgi:hypothetical protein